jgi:hypothetical protein
MNECQVPKSAKEMRIKRFYDLNQAQLQINIMPRLIFVGLR